MHFTLRRAAACDADAIANVYSASFRLLTFPPMLHTVEEDRRFIANVILKEFEVTVAEDETGIVAFLSRRGEEVRLLYTHPDRIGMGAGSQLIEASKATGVGALELANASSPRVPSTRDFVGDDRPERVRSRAGRLFQGFDARTVTRSPSTRSSVWARAKPKRPSAPPQSSAHRRSQVRRGKGLRAAPCHEPRPAAGRTWRAARRPARLGAR